MTYTKDILEKRKKYLIKTSNEVEKRLKKSPVGTLRTSKCRGKVQYYHRMAPSERVGKYIPYSNKNLAAMLAQKDYDKKLLKSICAEMKAIEICLDKLPVNCAEDIYLLLSETRKKLVTPAEETDESFVSRWESVSYKGKDFSSDFPEYLTDKGERVRSKSEMIIANMLAKEGIPYRYEFPITIHNVGIVYPDFTVLNVRLRKEYIWEHRGKMDDPEYAAKAINKENAYNLSGFYQGDNFIITNETKSDPLNVRILHGIIDHFFK